jgi:hypothetical protein
MAEKKSAKKSSSNGQLFFVKIVEKVIDLIQKVLTPKLYEFLKKWILILANITLYIAAGLCLIYGIIGAIRGEKFTFFAVGLGFAAAMAIVQFVGNRFSTANDNLVERNETQLASNTFLLTVGLLSALAGLAIFLFYTYSAIKLGDLGAFAYGLGGFVIFQFFAFVSLNPKTITIKIVSKSTAGEEAIGIITYFLKAVLRIVPIIFGIGIIVFTVMMFIDAFGLFKQGAAAVQFAWNAKVQNDMYNIVYVGLLPFAAYIGFLLAYLCVDIIKAILSIPQKMGKN